jgi:hypothetical protein
VRLLTGISRGGLIAIVVVCVIAAAGGLAAVTFSGGDGSTRTATEASIPGRATAADANRAVAVGMPQIVAPPQAAVMPKKPVSTRTGTTAATPSSSPATQPLATGGSTTCTHPSYTTSAQYGMWNLAPYFVYNNMWGISGYQVSQTLYACSYSNWYVTATMNNNSGDGHVKTYPNAQKDFSEPLISSLNSVTSTFAETSPGTGIYEDAYDIWLNGVASSGSTEVMIWNDNHGQSPAGSAQGSVTFDGRSYTVYRTSTGSYIAFVANSNFTSGSMNLLEFFKWIMAKGWIPANSTLGQVCYGVELVSTNNVPATFVFDNFSVTAS